MGNEATTSQVKDQATNAYTFETADTQSAITIAFERILSGYAGQVALVVIRLSYENEEKINLNRAAQNGQSTEYLINSLRPLVRKTDHVFLSGHSMYFLLLAAN